MSDKFIPRKRGQNLLIVEGNHEKNVLFKLLFKCFPEMKVNMDDIWIYGTNIYILYNDIVKEYGETWFDDDVDLPFVISKKKNTDEPRYKDDFTNIILVFDYEHHDPNFSEEKINSMQRYFGDMADVGQLYINYPMIESYQDVSSARDDDYIDKRISVNVNPGAKYKAMVRDSVVNKIIGIPEKLYKILNIRFSISDEELCRNCVREVLNLSDSEMMLIDIENILTRILADNDNISTMKYQFNSIISDMNYIDNNDSYWSYLKKIFRELIIINIIKGNRIQTHKKLSFDNYKEIYRDLDLEKILRCQNDDSRDCVNGYIWVLNTCIYIVPEYNIKLLAD